MKRELKTWISYGLKSWVLSVLVAILLATSFKSAIADWNVVPTGSMKPTIVEGDRIFVNKLAYDLKIPYTTRHISTWNDPDRGDIVVFYSPKDGTRMVKRIVGLPGDILELRENRLLLNGHAVKYGPLNQGKIETIPYPHDSDQLILNEDLPDRSHLIMISPFSRSINSFGPFRVPENHYFMMGDNRDNSADSRYFGFVERKSVVGRVKTVVISLDSSNHYKPRWDRFLFKLN